MEITSSSDQSAAASCISSSSWAFNGSAVASLLLLQLKGHRLETLWTGAWQDGCVRFQN